MLGFSVLDNVLIIGNEGDCDHHKIEDVNINNNQKVRGDDNQFKGLRCGIEIHFQK